MPAQTSSPPAALLPTEGLIERGAALPDQKQIKAAPDAPCPVSVIIPCFNGAVHLAGAVESVLTQGTPGTEILIVDDASTDGTANLAASLAERAPSILYLRQDVNTGPAAARNKGLQQARGRYICFLDADDEYAPGFFARMLPLLDQNPAVAGVVTGVELVDCHREVHPVQLRAMGRSLPSNLLVRRAAAELVGGFPEDPVFRGPGAGEDILFKQALGKWFKLLMDEGKFLRYRVKRDSHFDYFLDRTKVVDDELVFLQKAPEETSAELRAAQHRYMERARERLAVLRGLDSPLIPTSDRSNRHFQVIAEYDTLRAGPGAIEGFLHPQEGFALYTWAKQGPGKGAIVEIGSLLGRSTSWLAAGTRSAGREKVVAVDHFRGSPEHQPNASHPVAALAEAGFTLPEFLANLKRLKLQDWVEVRQGDSAAIGAAWQGPIRLLFIDGDHAYEATRQDTQAWSPHIVRGGLMAFHDVGVWPGVTEFYRELLASNSDWEEISKVRSLRVVWRREL